jgi:hypothetical protein
VCRQDEPGVGELGQQPAQLLAGERDAAAPLGGVQLEGPRGLQRDVGER